jgi:hypothetical protein
MRWIFLLVGIAGFALSLWAEPSNAIADPEDAAENAALIGLATTMGWCGLIGFAVMVLVFGWKRKTPTKP